MNRIVWGLTLITLMVLTACISAPRGSSTPPSALEANESEQKSEVTSEQVLFGAEEIIHNPVSISDQVLQILRRDERVKRHLVREDVPNDVLRSWFTASKITLNDDGLPHLIVQGTNAKLMGANLVPFWVLRISQRGADRVLQVDALSLEVLKTKTNTYRDIRASRATATEIVTTTYSFDGTRYRAQHTAREKITD